MRAFGAFFGHPDSWAKKRGSKIKRDSANMLMKFAYINEQKAEGIEGIRELGN